MKKFTALAAILAIGLAACEAPEEPEAVRGIDAINSEILTENIITLSSDEFEGRGPSSAGEEKTVAFLAEKFNAYGLQPGNDGSYYQEVPLVDITANTDQRMVISGGAADITLAYLDDYTASTRRVTEQIDVADSELVFVGYGIVAPEYGWNDYEGLDMTGKTAVILVNDPGYATRDESLFTGFAMTYYGRWTYKFEEAARQGADAAIVIHETGPAGYPWGVVRGGWSGQAFYLESADGNMSRTKVEGWITGAAATEIFTAAGLDLDALTEASSKQGFTPVPMGLNVSVSFSNEVNHSLSKNVVGIVPGSENPDEAFLYMAHWDHLGIGEADETGDNIYNGALDNASGTGALLELARAYGSLEVAPKRTMVFLAVTAEEQGLLGSQHYGENPIYPLNKTIGGLNMDGLSLLGRTKDILVTGFGLSELDANLEAAATAQGRVLKPDPDVEKGYYYRSDHFNLAKVGVPMIYPSGGFDSVEHGEQWGLEQAEDYVANRYHQPSDEYDPSWDLSGGVEDIQLYYHVGFDVANGDVWPNWNIGTAFRAIRDKSRKVSDAGERISIRTSVKYDANAEDVWEMIGAYDSLTQWLPSVKDIEVEGEGVGAIRKLTLADGSVVIERLEEVDEVNMSYTYSIIESPLPVKNYIATLQVKEDGEQCVVEWSSTFTADGVSAKKAEDIVMGLYDEGFAEIRRLVGF